MEEWGIGGVAVALVDDQRVVYSAGFGEARRDSVFRAGSISKQAAAYGRQHGIHVIEGGCPLMFGPTADFGHKVMRAALTLTGHVPRKVE
jgi:hypothetical protein